jgi:hypothetical protein
MNLKYKILPLLLLVAFTGCASLEVSHDYDPTADFTKLKTFDWIPMKKQAGANELTAKKIMSAVNSQLNAKGLTLNQENPDFLIGMQVSGKTSYGGSIGAGASVGIPVGKGYLNVGGGRSKAREKHEGTLVLDFIDPESKSLIWRGTATSTVNPNASPEEQRELINRAVAEMLTQFPPIKQ